MLGLLNIAVYLGAYAIKGHREQKDDEFRRSLNKSIGRGFYIDHKFKTRSVKNNRLVTISRGIHGPIVRDAKNGEIYYHADVEWEKEAPIREAMEKEEKKRAREKELKKRREDFESYREKLAPKGKTAYKLSKQETEETFAFLQPEIKGDRFRDFETEYLFTTRRFRTRSFYFSLTSGLIVRESDDSIRDGVAYHNEPCEKEIELFREKQLLYKEKGLSEKDLIPLESDFKYDMETYWERYVAKFGEV